MQANLFKLSIYFFLVTLFFGCSEPLVEQEEFEVIAEETDFIRASFYDTHQGVIQLRHEIAGGLDINGQRRETYFMRVGGGETSILQPESTVEFDDGISLILENGYAQLRDDSRIERLFGSELIVSISPNNNQRSTDTEVNLGRIPATLNSNIGFIPGGVKNGSSITWNVDPLYGGSIYLVAEYFPNMNDADISDLHPTGCIDYLTLDDTDGQYALNMLDFPCIPQGAVVFFTLIRGKAMEIISEQEGTDILLAYSSNTALSEV